MRRISLTLIVLLSVLLSTGFTSAQRTASASVVILDRNGQPTAQITDGDSIQLQVTFPQAVTQQEDINFLFDDSTVGSCLVANGSATCKTDSFPALGWHWNIHGEPQDAVIVQASADNGEIVAESNPITVKPRPVVMVHGFISNWQTWNKYLGPDGFLASLGLQGFAVGDEQVPGVLNTGVITNPPGRTNTRAQNAEILGKYINGVKQETGAGWWTWWCTAWAA